MAEIFIFCFPIFFPNMSGISDRMIIIYFIKLGWHDRYGLLILSVML